MAVFYCIAERSKKSQQEAWACLPPEAELQAARMRLAIKASGLQIVRAERGTHWFFPGRWKIFGRTGVCTLAWEFEKKGWRLFPCPSQSSFSRIIAEIVSPILANQVSPAEIISPILANQLSTTSR